MEKASQSAEIQSVQIVCVPPTGEFHLTLHLQYITNDPRDTLGDQAQCPRGL